MVMKRNSIHCPCESVTVYMMNVQPTPDQISNTASSDHSIESKGGMYGGLAWIGLGTPPLSTM